MNWWAVRYFTDKIEYRYVKAATIEKALKKIPKMNWNLDSNFIEAIELVDNGFGVWDEKTGLPL